MAENKYEYTKFNNVLKANDNSGVLAKADEIAYTWTDTETDKFGNPMFTVV